MTASLKRQALTLTLANAYTRALGLMLRLFSARLMGAQAMGVMEMASSAVTLAITPVTAGIPTAVSRLAARERQGSSTVLASGLHLVKRLSLVLMPLLLVTAPLAAWMLGDVRTLPSILTGVPSVGLLGLCAVYSGYFYGRSDALTPAVCECTEQTVRCALTLALLMLLPWGVAGKAALPGLAEAVAGVVVWRMFARRVHGRCGRPDPAVSRQLFRLAAPTTLSRLCQTALRALNAVVLPVCLRRSGLSQGAATAQFGMLGGMAMPLLMLPGVVTSAICMVATPAVSRQEHRPEALRRTMRKLLSSAALVGGAAGALLFLAADFLGLHLYDEAGLPPLLRLMSPCALLMALQQVQYGLITGLGLQRKALTATVAASALTLVLTAALCPLPQLRLFGAGIAQIASAALRTAWNQLILAKALRQR